MPDHQVPDSVMAKVIALLEPLRRSSPRFTAQKIEVLVHVIDFRPSKSAATQ
jgi:hypothetical protein